jgi:predicted MFS family arabinose efflux permease
MIAKKGRRFKVVCFTIGGVSSFAVSFYTYYLYFFMQKQFGFSGRDNLAFAALNGFIYVISAWQGGKFAQRCGYFTALKVGFGLMLVSLGIASQLNSAFGLILMTAVLMCGQCFIWPTVEALVSEGENADGLSRAVGTYNVVWAGTNALALFSGGTLVEKFGFKTMFFLPLAMMLAQLALVFWLQGHADDLAREAAKNPPPPVLPPDPHRPSRAKTQVFLRMAWIANPFAYIAINTFIPMLPDVAARFDLTPMFAGFACSLWCFVRLGTFFALWFWTGWHYRFRWLVTAFATLIIAFAAILTVPNLAVLIAAQIFFGLAIGLIYYSSLFYSMDAGDTKGEHGGIHEAALGVGNCVGPAVGAASLQFFPQYSHSGAIAVSVLLLGGLGSLIAIWKTAK